MQIFNLRLSNNVHIVYDNKYKLHYDLHFVHTFCVFKNKIIKCDNGSNFLFSPGPIIEAVTSFDFNVKHFSTFGTSNLGQRYTIDSACPTIGTFRDLFFPFILIKLMPKTSLNWFQTNNNNPTLDIITITAHI